MSESSDAIRDSLVRADPINAGLVLARDQVVTKWCEEHGTTKDALTMGQLMEIRALPEWENAG